MRQDNPRLVWVALFDNKTLHLVVMFDKGGNLKISVIVVWHVHCTHRTTTHLRKKLQLGLKELGDSYRRFLVTADMCG